jgi:hypothetical protein
MNLVDELIKVRTQLDELKRKERMLIQWLHEGKSKLVSSDGSKKASLSKMSMWSWDDNGLQEVLSDDEIIRYRKNSGYKLVVRLLKA